MSDTEPNRSLTPPEQQQPSRWAWLHALTHRQNPALPASSVQPIPLEESTRNAQEIIMNRQAAEAAEEARVKETTERVDAKYMTQLLGQLLDRSTSFSGKRKALMLTHEGQAQLETLGVHGVGIIALPLTGTEFVFDDTTGKIIYEYPKRKYFGLAIQTIQETNGKTTSITHPTLMQYAGLREDWVQTLRKNTPEGYSKDGTVTSIQGDNAQVFTRWVKGNYYALIFAWEKNGSKGTLFEVEMKRMKQLAEDFNLNLYRARDATGHYDYPGGVIYGVEVPKERLHEIGIAIAENPSKYSLTDDERNDPTKRENLMLLENNTLDDIISDLRNNMEFNYRNQETYEHLLGLSQEEYGESEEQYNKVMSYAKEELQQIHGREDVQNRSRDWLAILRGIDILRERNYAPRDFWAKINRLSYDKDIKHIQDAIEEAQETNPDFVEEMVELFERNKQYLGKFYGKNLS